MLPRQLPKISGLLNNCALHAIVPELLAATEYFAALEEVNGQAAESDKKIEAFRAHYVKLKNTFAQFYAINTHELTWKKMHALLTVSVNRNTAAVQFIMGPVLRQFMCENMQNSVVRGFDYAGIQQDGRYATLDAETVGEYVCKPLGIALISYLKTSSEDSLYQVTDENKVDAAAFTVEIYNENNRGGQHWERVPCEKVKDLVNGVEALSVDCAAIDVPFMMMTSSDNKEETLQGLDILKAVVNDLCANLPVEEINAVQPLAQSMLTSKHVDIIETNARPVVKELVKKLLLQSTQGLFNVPEGKKIDATVNALNQAKADHHESDEQFAKRLQEAEIRFALKK